MLVLTRAQVEALLDVDALIDALASAMAYLEDRFVRQPAPVVRSSRRLAESAMRIRLRFHPGETIT